ncbi:MAG: hypothetical protein AUK63_844 [bacterium P3]|nr:MAG: hypothetical protein AUK63_844 [bacterium P3]KWW41470.1 MAG: hypothetical protein F083_1032 [bacterium F083]
MKKIFILSMIALFASSFACAQDVANAQDTANGPKIQFESIIHDYGTLQKGGDGNCEFTFTNTGNEPLILSNVRASCGCTTPSWTQKPVMPGQKGTIAVRYNTNNPGGFTKSITVTSNAVNNPRIQLKIKGNVLKPE